MEAKTINVFESSVPMLDRNRPNAIEHRESRQRETSNKSVDVEKNEAYGKRNKTMVSDSI